MKHQMLAAAAAATLAASGSAGWAVTYQLHGSTLETCTITTYQNIDDTPYRACTTQEREIYKPPDGHTLDGRIHINENRLRDYLHLFTATDLMPNGTLANVDIPPTEITNVDAFTFDLANIVPFAEDYFALTTDAAKRPLRWWFELDANAPDYNDTEHPEGNFDGPTGYFDNALPGTASYRKLMDDNDQTIVNWTGQGGKLSVVPLPAGGGLLVLAGLALAGLASFGRRRMPSFMA